MGRPVGGMSPAGPASGPLIVPQACNSNAMISSDSTEKPVISCVMSGIARNRVEIQSRYASPPVNDAMGGADPGRRADHRHRAVQIVPVESVEEIHRFLSQRHETASS